MFIQRKKQKTNRIPRGSWKNYNDKGIRNNRKYPFGDIYKTQNGRYTFQFRFYPTVYGYYEIDILAMPSYKGRPASAYISHRITSSRGTTIICFGNPIDANTPSAARRWAKFWAEKTAKYIDYNIRF